MLFPGASFPPAFTDKPATVPLPPTSPPKPISKSPLPATVPLAIKTEFSTESGTI